ncbi:MAG: hypothetical protein K2U26_13175 [Cyclobacteriaceae bacterium]|nr:hypothetical protein [Cyclobacteriaceae bacterium]
MRYLKICAYLCGVGVLIAHFTFVGLYLLPDNPIKHQFKYELRGYVNPFFSQSWNLFSPTPINSNMTLLLQFKVYKSGAFDTTKWVDVYDPLIKEKRAKFWSPVQRLSKFMTSCMQSAIESNQSIVRTLKEDSTLLRDSIKANRVYHAYMASTFGAQSITQYSKYVLRRIFINENVDAFDSVFVKYEIFDSKFPRFSKRELDFFDLDNYTFAKVTSDFYRIE